MAGFPGTRFVVTQDGGTADDVSIMELSIETETKGDPDNQFRYIASCVLQARYENLTDIGTVNAGVVQATEMAGKFNGGPEVSITLTDTDWNNASGYWDLANERIVSVGPMGSLFTLIEQHWVSLTAWSTSGWESSPPTIVGAEGKLIVSAGDETAGPIFRDVSIDMDTIDKDSGEQSRYVVKATREREFKNVSSLSDISGTLVSIDTGALFGSFSGADPFYIGLDTAFGNSDGKWLLKSDKLVPAGANGCGSIINRQVWQNVAAFAASSWA